MAITKEATSPEVGNSEDLDKLLGGEEASAEAETETQEQEDAENPGEETEGTEQETQGEEEATEEEAEEGTESEEEEGSEEAEEEAEEEQTELSIDESERDYSEAAYKKAADHYARTKKVQLNPEDPAHRALLKEIMDRGRDFEALKRQEAERETGKKATEEAAEKPAEQAQQTRKPPTDEEIDAFTKNAATVAKARLIPKVAKHNINRLYKAWYASNIRAGEEIPEPTQEDANEISSVFHEMFLEALEDILPEIQRSSRSYLSTDPVFARVEAQTIGATAFEQMDELKDKAGKALYPDLEQMVESGALKKALDSNPEISKLVAGNGRDPVANQLLRYQTAYKIARGETVNLQTVSTAVNTGKKQAEQRAKKLAAGRVGSGKPSGGFNKGPSKDQQTISDITSGGESKFSKALRDGRTSK